MPTTTTTEFTPPSYDHLAAGDEGYWPLIAAVPGDLRNGDRILFEDGLWFLVSDVKHGVLKVSFATPTGQRFSIGCWYRGASIDRFGTSSKLSRLGTR